MYYLDIYYYYYYLCLFDIVRITALGALNNNYYRYDNNNGNQINCYSTLRYLFDRANEEKCSNLNESIYQKLVQIR